MLFPLVDEIKSVKMSSPPKIANRTSDVRGKLFEIRVQTYMIQDFNYCFDTNIVYHNLIFSNDIINFIN